MTLGQIPEARAPSEDELEREEKFSKKRVVLVAVDHGPMSQTAFSWALDQFVTHNDTLQVLHVLPSSKSSTGSSLTGGKNDLSHIYNATQFLFDNLAKEAYAKLNVKIVSMIRDGDAGKTICAEALRSKAVAIVMGCRGLGIVKSFLVGSTTDYCVRHSPVPLIIVPHNYAAPPTPAKNDAEESQET